MFDAIFNDTERCQYILEDSSKHANVCLMPCAKMPMYILCYFQRSWCMFDDVFKDANIWLMLFVYEVKFYGSLKPQLNTNNIGHSKAAIL